MRPRPAFVKYKPTKCLAESWPCAARGLAETAKNTPPRVTSIPMTWHTSPSHPQKLTCTSASCDGVTVACTTARWLSQMIWRARTRTMWSCWCWVSPDVSLKFSSSGRNMLSVTITGYIQLRAWLVVSVYWSKLRILTKPIILAWNNILSVMTRGQNACVHAPLSLCRSVEAA